MTRFTASVLSLAALLALSAPAQASQGAGDYLTPTTINSTNPNPNWRITSGLQINGVSTFDASVRITYTGADGGGYLCSGSLLAGGSYVLTAGHCGDDVKAGTNMTIQFGYFNGTATQTRTVAASDIILNPNWQGFDKSADAGSDLALLKLNTAVTSIQGYHLSTTNDVGKTYLMAGFGTTGTATANGTSANSDYARYGHYGFNTFDVDSKTFNLTLNGYVSGWGAEAGYYVGTTYMSDFDSANANNNTLQRIADVTGNAWSSSGVLPNNQEAIIGPGDSGGGDLVWSGGEWLLSAVHSWGWAANDPDSQGACDFVGITNCGKSGAANPVFGDLSGSTALFDQVAWISSVVGSQVVIAAVPEPGTWLMLGGGLLLIARRKSARRAD